MWPRTPAAAYGISGLITDFIFLPSFPRWACCLSLSCGSVLFQIASFNSPPPLLLTSHLNDSAGRIMGATSAFGRGACEFTAKLIRSSDDLIVACDWASVAPQVTAQFAQRNGMRPSRERLSPVSQGERADFCLSIPGHQRSHTFSRPLINYLKRVK